MTNIITLDNSSPEALAHALRQLDSSIQNSIAQTLREIENEGNEALILETVREVLARDLPGRQAAGVLFSSSISQCGYFYYLDITAQVLCDDGTITDVDFEQLDDALEEQWDVVGVNSTVLADLRHGTVTFRDSVPDLHRELNIPAPASPGGLRAHRSVADLPPVLAGRLREGLGRRRDHVAVTGRSREPSAPNR